MAAEQSGEDIFVHVSAFPRDGRQPIGGEPLSFEIERDRDGRKKAVRVQRPGVARTETPPRRHSMRAGSNASRPSGVWIIALLMIAALVVYGYQHYTDARQRAARVNAGPVENTLPLTAPPSSGKPSFQCDGRTHCSQMTSCAEATFFLKNCPGVQMDGNNDGVPCERQWCK